MQKEAWSWTSARLPGPARLVRWGHYGAPVLVFPSAGGDCEEIEQFQLIAALGPLLEQGRLKVYSIDGNGVRGWLAGRPVAACVRMQEDYAGFLSTEVLERIRQDCHDERIEPLLAGMALGAGSAMHAVCRRPELFGGAVCVSGVFDLAGRFGGVSAAQVGAFAPETALAGLTASQLDRLRERMLFMASGTGDLETPQESRRMAAALAAGAIPQRLVLWGAERGHTWSTWCGTLPALLAERV
ncbi:MAG TPA: alpha/beta hydrolase-fold protein [Steroidobacteraceae bacterium]|nr:alpha/beta hydrolase-fold protein [Steroidobacteraceae bacterium]